MHLCANVVSIIASSGVKQNVLRSHGGTALIISSFLSHHKVVELIGAEVNPYQQGKMRDRGVYSNLNNFNAILCIL